MPTKTWTTKADWDGGTYDRLYCPIGLARLEIAYDELSGKATYVFDGGAGKKFRWTGFSHSKEDTKIVWRDDFRANSISKYTWYSFPKWDDGAPAMPGYDAVNKRLIIDTGNDRGSTMEIPGVSMQNIIASIDVYVTAQYPATSATGIWLRYVDKNNNYIMLHQAEGGIPSDLAKWVGGVLTVLGSGTNFPKNAWRTLVFEINGNSLKAFTDEYSISASDGSHSSAGKVLMGCWQTIGYIGQALVEHYSVPSPPGTSVSFKFWGSTNGVAWGSEYTDITKVPNSRFIKIEVTMTRESLAKAMPVLKDMTLTYKLLVQPIFI